MRRTKNRESGLSLIEMMVILVVVGVIASITIVNVQNALEKSRQRTTMAEMRTVARTIAAYAADTNTLPDDTGGLPALMAVLIPYQTDTLPLEDGWGHRLHYDRDELGNYSIESFGKDGIDGPDFDGWKNVEFEHDIVLYNGIFVASPE